MYAIKTELGKERIRVRSHTSGFLPSYTSCAESSMGKRMLVVPGYVFTMKSVPGAEKVPDAEWKVIEALADSHPSTLDVKKKQIVDGPLKGLLIYRINPSLKSVCIRAKLLGTTRDYWLAVRFAAPDVEKDDVAEMTADVVESEKSTVEKETGKMAEKRTYTEEEKMAAIDLAKQIGIHAAGKELGIPWQTVQGFCKKAGVMATQSKMTHTKKVKATEPVVEEKKPTEAKPRGRKAKTAEPTSEPAVEMAVPAVEEKAATPSVEENKKPERAASALEIENAVLKAENEQLKAKIEKLQKALADLI